MSCAPPVVTLLLLLLVGGATAQSCFYRGTPGTCQQISTCPYAYEPSMLPVNTTGCQSNPDPMVQCCARVECTALSRTGFCRARSLCGGTPVQTNEGASGCQKLPGEIQCCLASAPTPFPTPRPAQTPSPTPFTPSPTPPRTPLPTPVPNATPVPTPPRTPSPTPPITPAPPGGPAPCTSTARTCPNANDECAPDGPNSAWQCGAKRTCATLGCTEANSRCVDVSGLGLMQCIVMASGCSMQCPFNEECRADPRGPQFPSVCAPKPIFGTPAPGATPAGNNNNGNDGDNSASSGTDAPGPGGLELWVILVIVGASLVVIMVCFCVIAVIIISRNRASASEREAANAAPGVGMYSFNGGGGTIGTHGQGSSYPAMGGAYPSGMGGAATPAGSATYSTGTGTFTREDLPAF